MFARPHIAGSGGGNSAKPSSSYPKLPESIALWTQLQTEIAEDGGPAQAKESPRRLETLKQVLDRYLIKFGYTGAQMVTVFYHLLVDGKVRIARADGEERIVLVDPDDVLAPDQANALFGDFLAERSRRQSPPKIQSARLRTARLSLP